MTKTTTETITPIESERPGLPVLPPLMALVEILVLMVVPGLLDYFWTGFPSLAETQPHFFWLPVLLLSLQYGTVSGLLAAGVAITITALLGWPDQEVGENHFNYLHSKPSSPPRKPRRSAMKRDSRSTSRP